MSSKRRLLANLFRLTLLSAFLLVLVGCMPDPQPTVEDFERTINSTDVTASLQYVQVRERGPIYEIAMTVPDDWVGSFEIEGTGNQLLFNYLVDGDIPALIFFVEALSEEQYWEQIGSYPGDYTNVVFTDDTYFVYRLPVDPVFATLDEELYAGFSEQVPTAMSSFSIERVDSMLMMP
ncbi:MAG: hypothetical protein GYB68_02265 [Chloroflexi bacterium]|nr:hypothetical protein [Chloroflexota bacterium]